jgi:hypothetical protein
MVRCDPHMGFDTFKYAVLQGRIMTQSEPDKIFNSRPGARSFRFSSSLPTGTNLTAQVGLSIADEAAVA